MSKFIIIIDFFEPSDNSSRGKMLIRLPWLNGVVCRVEKYYQKSFNVENSANVCTEPIGPNAST